MKIENLEISDSNKIYHNLDYSELIEHEINNGECFMSDSGATVVDTGDFTGRSPKDKYFVNQSPSNSNIAWNSINKPVEKKVFDELFELTKKQLSNKDIYVTDVYAGSSKQSQLKVRFISEIAWQSHFVQNMFIVPDRAQLNNFVADFTVYNACKITNNKFKEHGLNSDVFVIFDMEEKIAIIGGTWYSGEMKKGIFSIMNYLLPLDNKLPMHCSANIGKDGDTCLFFGLSGTGKTTLSTDPNRQLIGDDEHGWDNDGVFNFEGGCYAKVINLDKDSEPEIYGAIRKGALLENVIMNKDGVVDYSDKSKTENTRVSYPIEHISNHKKNLKGEHPKNIIFLTADAFGILPPISKLTKEQAMYYFLSGYTAKVAGTERGITEPVATFSACFGEAFLPLHPTKYAKLLGEKIDKYDVKVFLVNTGWSGGAYGVGKRMSIKVTRACITSILNGNINSCEFTKMPIFNLSIPLMLNDVEPNILNPINTWENKDEYNKSLKKLANMFVENFTRYQSKDSAFDYSKAGPKL
jgi:phosphoenolpyruvate carboxykinase (ATP)